MNIQNEQVKEGLTRRLNRLEGQIKGIAQMVADQRDCREIMQQFSAARSGLQSAIAEFLHDYMRLCLQNKSTSTREEQEFMLAEISNILKKV